MTTQGRPDVSEAQKAIIVESRLRAAKILCMMAETFANEIQFGEGVSKEDQDELRKAWVRFRMTQGPLTSDGDDRSTMSP